MGGSASPHGHPRRAPSPGPDHAPRAREVPLPFDGVPGPLDSRTDVPGVKVGMVTLISGDGPLRPGAGPVRTGVNAVLPRARPRPARPARPRPYRYDRLPLLRRPLPRLLHRQRVGALRSRPPWPGTREQLDRLAFVPLGHIDPLYGAVVHGVEEAVAEALLRDAPMTGRHGSHVPALPHRQARHLLQHHPRVQ